MVDFVVSDNIRSFGDLILGATPSLTGTIRLPNAGTISFRNVGNDADIPVFAFGASNIFEIGNQASPTDLAQIQIYSPEVSIPAGRFRITGDSAVEFVVETSGNASVFSVNTNSALITIGTGASLAGTWTFGLDLTTTHTEPAYAESVNVVDGNIEAIDPSSVGSETLQDGDFSSFANWTEASDFSEGTLNYVYLHSGGSGTLTQTAGNRTLIGENNRWYRFTYSLSAVTNVGALAIALASSGFPDFNVQLADPANGTFTVIFQSDQAASVNDFQISASSDTGGDGFTIDNVALVEITGGDVIMGGQLTGGGPLGLRIDGVGASFLTGPSFAIGTTPALTGEIRLPVNASITMRNAADNADISVLSMIATDIIEHGQASTVRQNIFGQVAINPTTASTGSLIVDTGTGLAAGFAVENDDGQFFIVGTTTGSEVIRILTPDGLQIEGDSGSAGNSIRTLTQSVLNSGVLASGSTFTFTDAIPAGARLISVTARVGQVLVGPTTWDLGISGGDIDRWGATLALSGGTQVGVADYTNTGVFEQDLFPTAVSILVTANGADFTAGTIGIVVTYETIAPPVN